MRTGNKVNWTYAIFAAVVGVVLTLITIWLHHLTWPEQSLVDYFACYDFEGHLGLSYKLPWFDSERKQISVLSSVFVCNALLSGLIGAAFGCALKFAKR